MPLRATVMLNPFPYPCILRQDWVLVPEHGWRAADLIPIMWKLLRVTRAHCFVEVTFDQPQESEPAIFPLPRSLDHIDNSAIDVMTGIRGIKHREGTTKPEYIFILDKTDAPTTALSLEFEWDGALAADTLAHVAERVTAIATRLGMPEPDAPEPNKLLRPRPRRHRH